MQRLVIIALAMCVAAAISVPAPSQARHRILRNQNAFEMEEITSGIKRPFDMWITRMANALFDPVYTDQVISNLDDYQRYGINTILVSVHGGGLGGATYPKVYNPDGSLDLTSIVWANLLKILDETDKRGMAVQIQYWYFLRVADVPLDADAVTATKNVTTWLQNTGYEHYMLDVVNEFAHPSHTRPLFKSLPGALQIIQAVRDENPNVLIGISPPSRMMFPIGTIGSKNYSADFIIGHNRVLDPSNRGAYWFNASPTTPTDYPYVNNEFWEQIAYERTRQIDPRTNKLSYGHFSPALVTEYIGGLTSLRGFNGYGGIHTRHQQHVVPGGVLPVAFVGPEGTQPEAVPGGGEPSVHWLYHAIAGMQRRGPVSLKLDFTEWASGFEEIAGTWAVNNGQYEQTDATADPAWSRIAIDGGEVEVAFDLRFPKDPGLTGAAGIMIGASTPSGPSYRLSVFKNRIELDQVGAPFTLESVALAKAAPNQYRLRLYDGRVQVLVDGTVHIDVADPTPLTGRNLILFSKTAAATFDHVRATPIEMVDFEDSTTGSWKPEVAAEWTIETQASNARWKAVTAPNARSRAMLDWHLGDFSLDTVVDLTNAPAFCVHFRASSMTGPTDGYELRIDATGQVTLVRTAITGPPTPLGTAAVTSFNPAAVALRLVAEGPTIAVFIDGNPALQVTDTGVPIRRGAVALIAETGTTYFDDLRVDVCPSRLPIARFLPFTGTPLPAGFTLEFGDPDGLLDVKYLQFMLNQGGSTFTDITFVLIPQFSIFKPTFTPDGRSVQFTLNAALPIGSNGWTLRLVATDKNGDTRITDLTL